MVYGLQIDEMISTRSNVKVKKRLPATPYLIWMIGFVICPLIAIAISAMTDKEGNITFENIFAIGDSINGQALLFSLAIAVGCTVICILLAYPTALVLRSMKFRKNGFTLFILILPMWMNFILRILAWQMILSKNGLLNLLLASIGLKPLEIANTPVALMIGMVYDFLPYMIMPVFNAISDIDEDVIDAARDLGAGKLNIFKKIILPLSIPGMLSGIVMVFVPAMTSFVIADILGGGKVQLIGNIIEQEFMKSMNWHLGSGLSISLMVMVMLGLAFTMKNDHGERDGGLW